MMILASNLDQYLNLTRETEQRQKTLTMTLCQKIVTSFTFFQFTPNSEQFESQIPDAQCVKHIFSLTETFYLTKTEKRAKKSQTQLSHYSF